MERFWVGARLWGNLEANRALSFMSNRKLLKVIQQGSDSRSLNRFGCFLTLMRA